MLKVYTDVFDLKDLNVREAVAHTLAMLSTRDHMVLEIRGEQRQELLEWVKAVDGRSQVFLELPAGYKEAPSNTLGTPDNLAALGVNQKRTYADPGTVHRVQSILELAAAEAKITDPHDNTSEVENILLAHQIITGNPISDRMEWADVTLGLKALINFLYLVRPRPVPADFEMRMREAERRWTLQSA